MAEPIEIPCIKLPEPPEIPSITLIGGAKLSGFADLSKGMPTDCQVTLSLLGQLAPALAALAPILQILGVVKAIADFASNPLVNGPDLIAEIGKIAGLFVSITPAGLAPTIVGILQLLIAFLKCVIGLMSSAIDVQAEIALQKAELEVSGEPISLVLQASIDCAELNASIALDQAGAMLGPIAPLADVIGVVAGLVGIEIAMPSVDVSAAADVQAAVGQLEAAVTALEEAVEVVAAIAGA